MKRIIILGVLLAVLGFAAPAQAAYNHLSVCETTLRGYGGSDDDIHREGVLIGAVSFGGWGTYWHSSGDVYVYGKFNMGGGVVWQELGHCWDGDWGPDSF